MKKKIFIYTTAIIFAGLLGFLAVSIFITNRNNLSMAKSTVMETARISAGLFHEGADLHEFVSVGGDTRITVISAEGEVLADSQPAEIADIDYLMRPEIAAAAAGAPEVQVRYSTTHSADFIYYALRVATDDGHVFVRAAIPVAQIDAYLIQSLPLLMLLLGALALVCFFVVRGVSNKILEPFASIEQNLRLLSRGEYENRPITATFPEIEKITREIDEIAAILQENYAALSDEKNKLTYILNSIGVGLFVADDDGEITLVNNAACEIFGASPEVSDKKINYLVSDKSLAAIIDDCIDNTKNALFEFTIAGKIYLVTVKQLPDTDLTMVALADITEARENAKRREEFFANASHELKTPLTAIKGFNELAGMNNTDENLKKYIDGITRETTRMMSLISDMLRLSEIENTPEVKNLTPVSLGAIVAEVRESLSAAIEEKSIKFEVTGDATISAEPNHAFEIVKNLIENAVRYNAKNGRVFVKIKATEKSTRLDISDNGIGISPVEQTKIFERFYRVEKSRSVQSGGTGLGLAIVKHICALYDWKLTLKSKLGIGTEVTVEF